MLFERNFYLFHGFNEYTWISLDTVLQTGALMLAKLMPPDTIAAIFNDINYFVKSY